LASKFRKFKKRKGFTLVELLIVVAIIAIMSAAMLSQFLPYSDKARETAAKKDIINMNTVVKAFAVENGFLPEESLDADNPRSIAAVMQSKGIKWTGDDNGVKDPWGNPYYYGLTEDSYYIASPGKDGKLSTSDDISLIKGQVVKKKSPLNRDAIPSASKKVNGDHVADVPEGFVGIWDAQDLAKIGVVTGYPIDGKYIVMDDIDLSEYDDWTPRGGNYSFRGEFNGNNYTISNLRIRSAHGLPRLGLFGWVDNGAIIENVILTNVDMDINQTGGALVGSITDGIIRNCSVSGQITSTSWVGGIVGEAYNAEISGCINNATINSTDNAGGIVANTVNSNISDCTNNGSIHGSCVAGIVGYNDGDISNCHNTGSVVGTGNYTGGIAGCYSGNSISNCSNTGPIQGGWATAGIAGYIDSGDISSCYNEADITATGGSIGGIAGYISGQVTDSYSIGDVSSPVADSIGGLVGTIEASGSISNCYTEGDVEGGLLVGGIVGQNQGAPIIDSHTIGNVTGTGYAVGGLAGTSSTVTNCYHEGNVDGGDYVGGLVGDASGSTINDSYSIGNVTGTGTSVGGLAGLAGAVSNSYAVGDVDGGGNCVGGLVGQCDGAISDSYATGNVTGAGDYVGGLAGTAGSTVTNSYALGNVTGTGACVGGLAGGAYGQVSYCYSIGLATTTAEEVPVGGLIGNGGDNVTSSYYNSDPVGQINNGIGTPLTAAQMKQQANFDGWDFDNVWSIDNSYPFLINNEQIPHPGI
jgi:prepilin-type N-terminal cleavage/methylation domain-containing protein